MQVSFKAKRNPNDKRLGLEKFNVYADYEVRNNGQLVDHSSEVVKAQVITPQDREYPASIPGRYSQGKNTNEGKQGK